MHFIFSTFIAHANTFKMKKYLLCLFLTLVFFKMQAQSNTLVSGGTATGSSGTLSYSLGQIDYSSLTGSGGSMTEGVQQPYELTFLDADDYPNIILQMKVYPNPFETQIILSISDFTSEYLEYSVYDMQGKLLISNKISAIETTLSLENQQAATYLLQVTDSGQLLKTFIIIKK